MTTQIRYVTLKKYEELTGISVASSKACIQRCKWAEGKEFIKSPVGKIMVNIEEVNKWLTSTRE